MNGLAKTVNLALPMFLALHEEMVEMLPQLMTQIEGKVAALEEVELLARMETQETQEIQDCQEIQERERILETQEMQVVQAIQEQMLGLAIQGMQVVQEIQETQPQGLLETLLFLETQEIKVQQQ